MRYTCLFYSVHLFHINPKILVVLAELFYNSITVCFLKSKAILEIGSFRMRKNAKSMLFIESKHIECNDFK